jgi:hypothetical protein
VVEANARSLSGTVGSEVVGDLTLASADRWPETRDPAVLRVVLGARRHARRYEAYLGDSRQTPIGVRRRITMRVEGLTDQDIETVPSGGVTQPAATNDGDAVDATDGDASDSSDGDASDSSDGDASDSSDGDATDSSDGDASDSSDGDATDSSDGDATDADGADADAHDA